jgi:hypothetical protein
VQAAAQELPSHRLGSVGRQAVVPHQRQQHQQAKEVAQELRLERVHLLAQPAHQRVQEAEDHPGRGGPQQALHRGRQVRRAPVHGIVHAPPGGLKAQDTAW